MMTLSASPSLSGPPRKPRASRRSSRGVGPVRPYPVFIAYATVPAARAAMARLAQWLEHQKENFQLQPMLWRFDQLDDARWREMALGDAARATTLVLALGDTPELGASGEAWLKALTARECGAKLSAVAFIGEDEAWTISLQQTRAVASRAAPPHDRATTTARAAAATSAAAAPAVAGGWQQDPALTLGEKAAAYAA